MIWFLCSGSVVRGEHARRPFRHPRRDSPHGCHPSWWWPDHSHSPQGSVRLSAHSRAQTHGARLPGGDSGETLHSSSTLLFKKKISFYIQAILIRVFSAFSAQSRWSAASTVCWTGNEATSLRSLRSWERQCSSLRPICLSTSLSVRNDSVFITLNDT